MNVDEGVQNKIRKSPRRRSPHDLYTWARLHPFRRASRGRVPSVPICAIRCIHNCSSGPQTIIQKHSRRLCERHSALHRGQTGTHPQGGARHPPCSLPLRWNRSSLRGRVDTAGRMSAGADVLAFDHLARERGRGKHSRLCEAKQATSTHAKQDVQLLQMLMLFP